MRGITFTHLSQRVRSCVIHSRQVRRPGQAEASGRAHLSEHAKSEAAVESEKKQQGADPDRFEWKEVRAAHEDLPGQRKRGSELMSSFEANFAVCREFQQSRFVQVQYLQRAGGK